MLITYYVKYFATHPTHSASSYKLHTLTHYEDTQFLVAMGIAKVIPSDSGLERPVVSLPFLAKRCNRAADL